VNTIELVLPSAHPTLQPELQIDRFSHFAQLTAECRRARRGMSFPTAALHGGSGSHACFLGPTRVHNPNGISIGSALPLKITPSHGDLYSHLRGSLGPPDSASQTASQSVQPFFRDDRTVMSILYNGTPLPPKLPLPIGDVGPI